MKSAVQEALRSVLARVANAPDRVADCLDQRAEALIAFTSERRIAAANEAAERFFGYERHELDGLPIDFLLPPRLRQPNAAPPLATDDLMSVELPSRRKDGTEVPSVWIFGSVHRPAPIFVMAFLDRDQASVVRLPSEPIAAAADRIRRRGESVQDHAEADVAKLIRSTDWSASPVGPTEAWPASLRTVLRLMLSSRYAMWLGWGPELTFFCNDSYRVQTLGRKYPWAIGRPAREVWAEIWDVVGPRIEHVLATGEATLDEGLLLFLERSGYPEETYHSFSYSAAPAEEGIGGLFCVVVEETERVIGERRIAFLGHFAASLSQARSREDVFGALEACLRAEPLDVPFSVAYLFDAETAVARRRGFTGFEGEGEATPDTIAADANAPWPVASVRSKNEPLLVELDGQKAWPRGPWKVAPKTAVMLPIAGATGDSAAGVLIAGLNPHRPYDDKYREFLTLLVGQLAAGLSTASAYEADKKRAEALAAIDRAKTTFFSNVSHEFRTPLTLMLAPLEDLRASASSGWEERERIELLHRNAQRLLRLVNSLLDFSRIEAGRVDAVYEPTDLAALTADLASTFRSTMERAGLAYHVETERLAGAVYVDRGMWEKIVLNLLSNAFKFTFQGSVTVRLRESQGSAELVVSDTGTGISARELPRLFERFHRIEGARSRSHEGTGIGLALVHELVRIHGGRIEVASEEGVGTTFSIKIPHGTAHLPSERIRAERALQSTATSASAFVEEASRWIPAGPRDSVSNGEDRATPTQALPKARIVVADDNADMREYVSRLLREHWTVEAVADGRAALDAIRRNPPDLVVSDVMMPGLDGFQLMQAVREDVSLRDTPIVLLSAKAGEEAVNEGLAAGADDYLVKPFTARDLLVRVAARLAAAASARALREQRTNLYRTFMQVPFPIAILRGNDHVIETVNNATLDAWGRGPEVIGKPLLDALPELKGQPFPTLLDEVFATGTTHVGREELARVARRPDGVLEDVFFNYVYAPIFDAGGHPEAIMVCAFDTTEQVLARQRLDGLRRVAEQASRAKDEFLSTLSHELRTPLNAIVGWSALLKQGAIAPDQIARVVGTIERNARIQARLIDDLLELSRIEQGKLVLSVGPVEMVRVVQAAIDTCAPAADAKGVRVQPVLDSHATIVGDPERLQQIVWNLLSNAIKFTPRGGRVQIRLRREHSYVELVVSDTGQGIEPTFLPHVFDRFRQADGSSTRRTGGLGLGLAIARSLVELHGGTIHAESEGNGRGATFSVRLPTAPLRVDASSQAREARKTTQESEAAEPTSFSCPPELHGLRIFVVDDEPETRALLEYVLGQCDAVVSTGANASEAFRALKNGTFDVLVSDVGMPDEDGHSLLRRVRALPGARGQIPAVALTAYARSEDRAAAFKAGFDVHLAKPIDPNELLIVIARLVSRRVPSPEQDG